LIRGVDPTPKRGFRERQAALNSLIVPLSIIVVFSFVVIVISIRLLAETLGDGIVWVALQDVTRGSFRNYAICVLLQ